jgi:two-component system phosphate regulon sensor histidine kinase PhoR
MLAHRFKEPLAVLRTCVGVVLQGYVGEISPRAKGMIEVAGERADQMIRFVDDWLTLSRLDQGKGIQQTQVVDVAEAANAAVERVRQHSQADRLTICLVTRSHPGTVRADPSALEELLDNLLDNAVRYTPAGGSVTVEVAGTETEAAVIVRDTGPGIAPEDLEHIFRPFYRGNAQKNIPGTGLGLPIAKRIAEAHGGRIEVRSTPGEGAAFEVFLPRADVKAVEGALAGEGR